LRKALFQGKGAQGEGKKKRAVKIGITLLSIVNLRLLVLFPEMGSKGCANTATHCIHTLTCFFAAFTATQKPRKFHKV